MQLQVGIKWPNDLLGSDGRKLAGLLAEADGGRDPFVVLGIGINVGHAVDLPHAGCLADYGDPPPLAELAVALATALVNLPELVAREPSSLLDRWRACSCTLGRSVRVGDVEGVAEDVDPTGALILRSPRGARHRILAGDVEMVRSMSHPS